MAIDPEKLAEIRAEVMRQEIGQKPEGIFALIAFYRLYIALALILLGSILFAFQGFSMANQARPHQILSWITVQDRAELNVLLNEAPEGETPDELPRIDGHYTGDIADGFADRLAALAEELNFPERMIAIPVELSRINSENILPSGRENDPPYMHCYLTTENAFLLLGEYRETLGDLTGNDYLGPFPYRSTNAQLSLRTDDGELPLSSLPSSASALQGFVISVRERIEPNAWFLASGGDLKISEYLTSIQNFSDQLSNKYYQFADAKEAADMIPLLGFSDKRHDLLTYSLAIVGELLFFVGGWLLLFHLFVKIARREITERTNDFLKWIMETCQVIYDHKALYAVSISLFLLFWLYGSVTAFADPGGQQLSVLGFAQQIMSGSGPLGYAGQAYSSGNILNAAWATFLVNFPLGTVIALALPSFIPIGSAFLVNALRAEVFGVALAPAKIFAGQALIPHLITIVVEFQAYLIVGFISLLLPLALLKPERLGVETRLAAFKKFALIMMKSMLLVGLILAIAAIYEAIEIIALGYIM